jgi:hypothetical protein
VVFGERCFEANHWRKKTAIAANSGGRDLLDDLPVRGIDTAEELCRRGVEIAAFTGFSDWSARN